MARIPSRSTVQLALVCVAVALILPAYGGILPPRWHLLCMGAAILLVVLATCIHDRSRARTGPVALTATGPKIRLPRRKR